MAEVVFWTCVATLLYTYVGYPAALVLLARRPSAPAPRSEPPRVSVVIAAYNEERCIEAKIRNTVTQHYPSHQLECVIVSDGSTDRTVEVARAVDDSRVRVIVQSPNQGKCLALNRGVKEATGDVIVFTDANAMLEPDAIAILVRPFSDARVGLVSGKGIFLEHREGSVHVVSNTYLDYEHFLRDREKVFGYIAWADGAFYGLRKSLFRDLRPVHSNDFLHPIQTVLQGYRATFEPRAIFREETSGTARGEFWRQVRMIGQGFYILFTEGPRLVARRQWAAVWQLVSHRLLRWFGLVFLAGAFASNAYLASGSHLYLALMLGQAAFYLAAIVGGIGETIGCRLRGFAIPYYFCLVNFAGLLGLGQLLRGGVQATWKPVRVG
jgi:cellulose synthase/poly-beta-1,6-N-acetylglucosamine synthase-like glycosyltransferase